MQQECFRNRSKDLVFLAFLLLSFVFSPKFFNTWKICLVLIFFRIRKQLKTKAKIIKQEFDDLFLCNTWDTLSLHFTLSMHVSLTLHFLCHIIFTFTPLSLSICKSFTKVYLRKHVFISKVKIMWYCWMVSLSS